MQTRDSRGSHAAICGVIRTFFPTRDPVSSTGRLAPFAEALPNLIAACYLFGKSVN